MADNMADTLERACERKGCSNVFAVDQTDNRLSAKRYCSEVCQKRAANMRADKRKRKENAALKEQLVALKEENASLRADNAALVAKFKAKKVVDDF
jgi:hypothetical protein